MRAFWMRRVLVLAVLVALPGGFCPWFGCTAARAQGSQADALNAQLLQFYEQGRYAEAAAVAKRVLALYEAALPAGHPTIADWVILSACNTAAGGAQGAEALSGLARAFIYAGARALLVSHWAVESGATVKLITSAVGTITRDRRVGRAEALRRAMLGMIEAGGREAHPALWAPFIVVGEGAAAR